MLPTSSASLSQHPPLDELIPPVASGPTHKPRVSTSVLQPGPPKFQIHSHCLLGRSPTGQQTPRQQVPAELVVPLSSLLDSPSPPARRGSPRTCIYSSSSSLLGCPCILSVISPCTSLFSEKIVSSQGHWVRGGWGFWPSAEP